MLNVKIKLKPEVVESLRSVVVDEHLPSVVKKIEAMGHTEILFEFNVPARQSKLQRQVVIAFCNDDFKVVDDLKPGVWYPRAKWCENPNGYMVVQALDKDMCKKYGISPYDFGVHPVALWKEATHFMYVEPLGENK